MYEAIASAIEKPLKGDVFERCAVELLREAYYPNLRPVEGGNDAGFGRSWGVPGRGAFLPCFDGWEGRPRQSSREYPESSEGRGRPEGHCVCNDPRGLRPTTVRLEAPALRGVRCPSPQRARPGGFHPTSVRQPQMAKGPARRPWASTGADTVPHEPASDASGPTDRALTMRSPNCETSRVISCWPASPASVRRSCSRS